LKPPGAPGRISTETEGDPCTMKQLQQTMLRLVLLCAAVCISCSANGRRIVIGSTLDESRPVRASEVEDAARGGVRFLVKGQNADGSWGTLDFGRPWQVTLGTFASADAFRDATTALCCMALMAALPDEREGSGLPEMSKTEINSARLALKNGLTFLCSRTPEGRADPRVLYHCWTQAYVLQCLSRALLAGDVGVPKATIQSAAEKSLAMMLKMQAATGGWGYYEFGYLTDKPSGMWSTSFTTATVLCAMHDAEEAGLKIDRAARVAATKFVLSTRTVLGDYVYSVDARTRPQRPYNRSQGAAPRAQVCNLALFRHTEHLGVDEIKRGLDSFFELHHFVEMADKRPYPHEAWYNNSGYYFLFAHFYAAELIGELPERDQPRYWKALSRALIDCRQPDGSWWDYPLYGYYKEYGTAFAVLSLVPAANGLRECPDNASSPKPQSKLEIRSPKQ
jgi:hypothetical protein